MAKKRVYTDEDRARVKTVLEVNDGNVKRTSRDTGVAEQTVRDWKKQWERGGLPEKVRAALPAVAEATTNEYEAVVNKAVQRTLELLDDDKLKARDAAWIAGVFTDKLRLIRGEATSRTESVNTGPTAEEIGNSVVQALEQAVRMQQEREADIVDVEIEQAALPSGA